MVNPRFHCGADESKQIAKGEKVAEVVPHVEKEEGLLRQAKSLNH